MKLDQFLDQLLKKAAKAGFEAAEAYVASGKSARIMVYEGEVSNSDLSGTMGVSFRGMVNGRMGYASTETLDAESIDMLITRARDNALTVRSDDKQFIYQPVGESYPAIEHACDPSLDTLTPAKLIEHCLAMEAAAKQADERILRLNYCMGFRGEGEVRIVNSHGLNLSFKDNMAYLFASPVAQDGEGMVSGSYFWAGNQAGQIDPAHVGREAAQDALRYIGAQPVASGRYPVVLRHDAMASLLSVFSSAFSAENAQRGLSLLAGKEGTVIASPLVTLADDPLLPRGYASRPFDDEGVPTRVKDIIHEGTLTTLLHNLKTAHKQGVQSTGNASKAGYGAPVSIAPFNFFLRPSTQSYEALLNQLGNGLLICELAGLHAGANAVTGDFSLVAKGFLVENGKLVRPVDQITIAGNFFSLLKDITALADDLWFDLPDGGACGSPSVLLSSVSVAGT